MQDLEVVSSGLGLCLGARQVRHVSGGL